MLSISKKSCVKNVMWNSKCKKVELACLSDELPKTENNLNALSNLKEQQGKTKCEWEAESEQVQSSALYLNSKDWP